MAGLFDKVRGRHRQASCTVPYDPSQQYPVIRASICTGEKVAGFRSRADGHFTEVMLIRTPEDERSFKETYHIDVLPTEY